MKFLVDNRLFRNKFFPQGKSFVTCVQVRLKVETQDIPSIRNQPAGTPGQDTKTWTYGHPLGHRAYDA
jgi:hypothetical protein